MDMRAALVLVARDILPGQTGFGDATLDERADQGLIADLGPASDRRRQEFSAGRLAVDRAMQSIGLGSKPVPRAEDRGPVWPKGVVGAISHAGQYAVAIVAKRDHHGGLGIDLVAPSDWPEPDLWPLFLHPDEGAIKSRAQAAAALAAKEATIKLLRDATGSTPGFLDLSVDLERDAGLFSVRIDPAHQCAKRITAVCGKLRFVGGHVLALCATAPLCHISQERAEIG